MEVVVAPMTFHADGSLTATERVVLDDYVREGWGGDVITSLDVDVDGDGFSDFVRSVLHPACPDGTSLSVMSGGPELLVGTPRLGAPICAPLQVSAVSVDFLEAGVVGRVAGRQGGEAVSILTLPGW